MDFQHTSEDKDQVIWQYMTFTEFVALLNSQALFFCRVDRLQDPLGRGLS